MLPKLKKIVVLLCLLVIVPLVFQRVTTSEQFIDFKSVVNQNIFLYIVLLLFLKAISITYPPLPGAVFTVGSIPLIGWELSYVIDFLGSVLGASLAFYFGQEYGPAFLRWVLGEKFFAKVSSLSVKQSSQVEAAIVMRIMLGGLLSDGLAWSAPLIGFKFIPFIVGYAISHLITTLPIFYLLSVTTNFESAYLVLPMVILAWVVMYFLKGRFFE